MDKLCKNCKHCVPFSMLFGLYKDWSLGKCGRKTDPVTGEAGPFCKNERDEGLSNLTDSILRYNTEHCKRPCGPEGRHFEKKD